MATKLQLITEVKRVIQDSVFTSSTILGYLNRGMTEIAAGFRMPDGSKIPPLPGLSSSGTVDTSTSANYVSLPATFQRNLFKAESDDNSRALRLRSYRELMRTYTPVGELSGAVDIVAPHGSRIYYHPVPTTAETLNVFFYRKPVDMSANDDTPDGLDEQYHYSCLVNYAAEKIFALVDPKVADRYKVEFLTALADLQRDIPDDGDPEYLDDYTEYPNASSW